MKRYIPIFILIAIVLIFFRPFFQHRLLPIPADTIVGMFYPFRDLSAQTNPNGLPFHNSLITDPVQQQYPWRNLVVSLEKHWQLPLWNPYTFSGSPLLANFQSAAFYPLNIVFFILPFSTAWSILVILQPLLGGIFLYLYLKNLKLHPLACLLGGITFAFCGFSVAWLEWNTVVQTVIWLPLILLAKDKLLEKWTVQWTGVFLLAEIAAVFAGHLQVLFYAICISNAYLAVRIFPKAQQNPRGKKYFVPTMARIYIPFLIVGVILFGITAVQWFPTLQFINLSARNVDQNWHQAGWFIPWQNLVQFIIPDFFGNPATGNYWGVWNYGEFIGYVGIVPLVLGLFALFFRHDKKTLFFGTVFFLSLLFAFPTFLAIVPFQLQIPFLSTAQPTRLLFVTDFSLAILSALGMDYVVGAGCIVPLRWIIGFLGVVFAGIWGFVLLHPNENFLIAKHNMVLPTVLFLIAAIVFILGSFGRKRTVIAYVLIGITVFDLFRFASKFETFAPASYLYPATNVTSFLQHHAGLSRIMTTDDRILPPNFSVMYHLQDVDGYDPLYLLRYGELIAASERKKPDIVPPFGFSRIVRPKNYDSPIMDLLGVKYVLSLSDIESSHLTKVFQDGQTRIYENQRTFPRAIVVENIESVSDKQQAIRRLFDTDFPFATTAVVEELPSGRKRSFAPTNGLPKIISYAENKIVIETSTYEDTFLILFDQYYPTWHATIDGKETKIYRADYTFRGIFVPKGMHNITFYDRLF